MSWKVLFIACFLVVITLPVFLLLFAVGMSRAIRHTELFPFERAIPVAFEELRASGEPGRFTFVCRGFECEKVLPRLGPVSRTECDSFMWPFGACCHADFGRGDVSEVHVYWQGPGMYKLTLTPPMCEDPATESSKDTTAAEGQRWVHCDELPTT